MSYVPANDPRWLRSEPAGVQPYNDAVRAELEDVLREVVALGDRDAMTAVELIENYRAVAFGDAYGSVEPFADLEAILEPHTAPEFDVEDLTFELLELAGSPDDDMHND